MAKHKLQRFAETATFSNFVQPSAYHCTDNYHLKGVWSREFFHNHHPLILELGCGKGEYTVGLAREHPENNYIGMDIKGARMWRGAKTALDESIENVGFLRTHIGQIEQFFGKDEISEIWITFPDPQPQKPRTNKRLTSQRFLMRYKNILQSGAPIHLKTDNAAFFDFTLEIIKENHHTLHYQTHDLYSTGVHNELTHIQTHYESLFLAAGKKICYLKFSLHP
ncbi:MAG: tRNA (guanosine(46)-N7)-methyltransferase TrmB [Bacteroidota bacterium]